MRAGPLDPLLDQDVHNHAVRVIALAAVEVGQHERIFRAPRPLGCLRILGQVDGGDFIWHPDVDPPVPSVVFVSYSTPLDVATSAVTPGAMHPYIESGKTPSAMFSGKQVTRCRHFKTVQFEEDGVTLRIRLFHIPQS